MSAPVLVVATHNRGKLREIAAALAGSNIEVTGIEALDDTTEVPETGVTFEDNARLKAEGYSLRTDLPVLADDSGIEVDALGGAPGVHSARYGGKGVTDPERNLVLLRELEGVPRQRRTARFRCVLAVARAGVTLATFEGRVEGRILNAPVGDQGFGYDPIFFHPESDRGFGELTREEKQRVSHRGLALHALVEAIRNGDPRLAGLGQTS